MPPRLPTPCLVSSPASTSTTLITPQCHRRPLPSTRTFSSTPQNASKLRDSMYRWLTGPGAVHRAPVPGLTNYLTDYDRDGRHKHDPENNRVGGSLDQKDGVSQGRDREQLQPFPQNRFFKSQPVLSENLREEVWRRVMVEGRSVRVVSAELGIEMRRVGAVVRLKEVEKDWAKKGRQLTTPYSRTILSMLPTTPYHPPTATSSTTTALPSPHESINDLPTHPLTTPQIFHPVPESRPFTRAHAAAVFSSPTETPLLPADARIPHPELIAIERERLDGHTREERLAFQQEREEKERRELQQKAAWRRAREERRVRVVDGAEGTSSSRWAWRFEDIRVEDAGPDGRGLKGVGSRYGIPREDRKKGGVKITTRV